MTPEDLIQQQAQRTEKAIHAHKNLIDLEIRLQNAQQAAPFYTAELKKEEAAYRSPQSLLLGGPRDEERLKFLADLERGRQKTAALSAILKELPLKKAYAEGEAEAYADDLPNTWNARQEHASILANLEKIDEKTNATQLFYVPPPSPQVSGADIVGGAWSRLTSWYYGAAADKG